MTKVLVILGFICAITGAAAPWVAWDIQRSSGAYMRLINEIDGDTLAKNRLTFQEGDDPASLYGAPTEIREWVVWYQPARLIAAPEAKVLGENWLLTSAEYQPVQTRTVWTVARFACGGLMIVGGVFFVIAAFVARRAAPRNTRSSAVAA